MPRNAYPKNQFLRNGRLADLYLSCLRKRWRVPARALGLLLNCDIACGIPERLHIPHPTGIIVGGYCRIMNDVVLLQQATLGISSPYFDKDVSVEEAYPTVEEGVYVGPGARILGHITVGKWSVIGANAVVTMDIPEFSIVVGHNKILEKKSTDIRWTPN